MNFSESDQRSNLLVLHHIVDLGDQLPKMLRVLSLVRQLGKSSEPVSRVMRSGPLLLEGFDPALTNSLLHFGGRQHAHVGADPQAVLGGHSVTVVGPAVEQDEITSSGVQLDVVAEGLLDLLLLGELVPVALVLHQASLLEVGLVVQVGLRHADEPALVLLRVSQGHDALVAPDIVLHGRLVGVEEGIVGPLLVLAGPVHETEPVKGSPELVGTPELLEDGLAALPEVPLGLRVADVLDHAAVQEGRVVGIDPVGLPVVSGEPALREQLHDVPDLAHVLLALLGLQVAGDDHEAVLRQVVTPELGLVEGDPVLAGLVVRNVHH